MSEFQTPKSGSLYAQVAQATLPPYCCIAIPGAGGPYLALGEIGFLSQTAVGALVDAAGWPRPEEVEQLTAELAAAKAKVSELERELAARQIDEEKVAAAHELFANLDKNRALTNLFAPAPA